jgi:choice-of-anchor C domain-containing protein
MKTRSLLGAAVAMVASIAVAGSALAAFPGVTNGSFEDGTYPGGPFVQVNAGITGPTGWTVSAGSIDWVAGLWQAQAGSKSLDLNGVAPGTISQTLATTIGKTYVVSFYLSGNPQGGPAAKTLTVSATGSAPASYTFDTSVAQNTVTDMKWSAKSYSFVATNTSTVLAFASTTSASAYGPALDNVVVTESGTGTGATKASCKKGGWKTLTDSAGHHFKNQGDCVSFYASGGKNLAAGS